MQGWEDAVANWQEIPKGGINRGPGAIKKIWYNPAVCAAPCGGDGIKVASWELRVAASLLGRSFHCGAPLASPRSSAVAS